MNKFWENMAYLSLALCVVGNIVVGYLYLIAQGIFCVSNIIAVVRDFAMKREAADKVRDISFLAISVGLIIIRLWIK